MPNSPVDIRRWNMAPVAPSAPAAPSAATAYGTQSNTSGGGGLMSGIGAMPKAPGLMESILFSGIPGYTENKYKDRMARWRLNAEQMVAKQAQARMAGAMNPQGQDLMMQPQQGGLLGPAQQQWKEGLSPVMKEALRYDMRAQVYDEYNMPIKANEARSLSAQAAQSGYEFERKENRADLTESRSQQAHELKMERAILGDPVKERQAPQLASLYVTKAQELVESAGGIDNMTGADDEALITYYVKALRPLESVMSEEAARAMEMSQSEQFRLWVESFTEKNKLGTEARQKILDTLGSVGENAWSEYQRLTGDIRSRAQRFGVPMGSEISKPSGRIQWE